MNYEIFSYGNVDALSGLFNALAALMAGSAFVQAVAVVFVVGFFGAFFASALAPDRLIGPKWLMSVILIYLVLFVPKATVQVVDKVGSQPPAVIGNVPLGLAFQAGLTSSVSNTLTELFESALQVLPGGISLPSDLAYTSHGLVFGAKVVTTTQGASFTDLRFKTNLTQFLQNCTFYDLSQGAISARLFATMDDIWPALQDTNPARFTPYADNSDIVSAVTCPNAYAFLDAEMNSQAVPSLMQKLGLALNPALQLGTGSGALPGLQAASMLDQQIGAAYARFNIANAALSAATIVRQNAIITAVQEANMLGNQTANDPAAIMLGTAKYQATVQSNAQQIVAGRVATEALPLIRNAIEAVLYALFPFVLLLALMTGGMQAYQMLKMYGLALVWISLWPPIYAVINYLSTMAIAKNAAAAAFISETGTQGLTLATHSAIYSGLISDIAVVSNLVMAVPAIAGALVFGMNKMAHIAAGFTATTTSAAGTYAGAAATGNVSMGSVSFDQQQLSPNRSDAFMSSYSDTKGTVTRDMTTGDMRYQQNVGKLAFSLTSSTETANRFSESSAKSHAKGVDDAIQAARETGVTLDKALTWQKSHGTGTQGNAAYNESHGTGTETAMSKLAEIRQQFMKDLKISDTSRATSALSLALGVKNNDNRTSATGDASFGEERVISKLLNVGLDAKGTQATDNQIAAAVSKARSAARAAGITDLTKLADNYTHTQSFADLSKTDQSQADSIRAGITSSTRLNESASRNFRQAEEYRQSAEHVKSAALRGNIDWTPEFGNFLASKGKLGVTGDELIKEANSFFHQTGIGVGADGQPKAVLYDGQGGPGRVTITPGSYKDPNVLRDQALHGGPMKVGGQNVTSGSLATQNAANRHQVETKGSGTPMAPVNSDGLKANYDTKQTEQRTKIQGGRGQVEAGEAERKQDMAEANDNTSIFHNFGWQPDGRSAKQQARKELDEK